MGWQTRLHNRHMVLAQLTIDDKNYLALPG